MGNIAYITTRRHIQNIDWETILPELNESLFGNYFQITIERGPEVHIEVTCEGREWPLWHWWEESPRKIGGKHPRVHDWGKWAWFHMSHVLAHRLDGHLSDEGVEGTWKGGPDKFITFQHYWDVMHSWHPDDNPEYDEFIKQYRQGQIDKIPAALRPYSGV